MSLPLQGYCVIELAQIYAGPYCGLQLAHFGAEVIKIEPPGTGELLRTRPPAKHGTNYGFLMLNPGKKSVSLNLKDPRGRDILFRMLADADVLLENYAPEALERLGLGYDDLASRFPLLVYASSKGYGRDSRFAPGTAQADRPLLPRRSGRCGRSRDVGRRTGTSGGQARRRCPGHRG